MRHRETRGGRSAAKNHVMPRDMVLVSLRPARARYTPGSGRMARSAAGHAARARCAATTGSTAVLTAGSMADLAAVN